MPEAATTEPTTGAVAEQVAETDWKAEARKWEKRAKDNASELEAAKPKASEYDRLVEVSKTDLERKAEEVTRWQTEAERWRSSTVTSRIEAIAATDFAYPADAVAKLDPARYLDAGGQIDESAIKADLAALLDERPNWRRQEAASGPRNPAPNPAQGAGGNAAPTDPAAVFGQFIHDSLQ